MNNFKINNIQYTHILGDKNTTFDVHKLEPSGKSSIHGVFVIKGWVDVLKIIMSMNDEDVFAILDSSAMFVEKQHSKH